MEVEIPGVGVLSNPVRDGPPMIEFSQRLHALPGYPLAEIPSIKRRLIEAGMDVIDLGAGDNDTPPPAVAVEAMTEALAISRPTASTASSRACRRSARPRRAGWSGASACASTR